MGLRGHETDPVYATHEQFYDLSSDDGTAVMLLENVPEYQMEEMVHSHMGPQWTVETACIDPRHFGMGCARPRRYGIAWDRTKVCWRKNMSFQAILLSMFAQPMMDALSYFTKKAQPATLTESEDTCIVIIVIYAFGLPKQIGDVVKQTM